MSRLTAVRNSSGTALASYTYDSRSRRTGLEYPNGASIDYSYDAASRLLVIDNQTGNGQHKHTYTYDYVGNRMTMAVTDNSGTAMHVYDYDSIYQLTGVDYPTGFDPLLATDTTFGYDAAGNRTSVIDGSGTCTYTANNLNQYTAAGPDSFTYSLSGNMTGDGHYGYSYDPENRLTTVWRAGQQPPADPLAEAVDVELHFTTGGDANWQPTNWPYHYDGDSATGTAWRNGNSWMQTEVEGAGTITFWWKVSSESGGDYLEFYIDNVLQNYPISGEQAWAEVSLPVTGSGAHTLRWQYTKDDDDTTEGDDRGWVDYVQWTGQAPMPEEWTEVEYVYDASGRRIEKKYDWATVLKYLYDGDHCIAEYDASNTLARKYIFGPSVDEPICMIEAAGSYAGTYYYHYDALGSVIALSDGDGDTVEVYEYDVYGRVGASDPNHPNRFMFTGREFDRETGLYYYRARYYNPQIGRFLQTDPVGYGAGMNLYGYCGNSPIGLTDPSGLWAGYRSRWVQDANQWKLAIQCLNADGSVGTDFYFNSWDDAFAYVQGTGIYSTPGDFCDGKFDAGAFWHWTNDARGKDRGPDGTPASGTGWTSTVKRAGAVIIGGIAVGAVDGPSPVADIIYWGSAVYAGVKGASIVSDALTARRSKDDLPGQGGPPNGSLVRDDGKGNGQIRDFGPDGRATKDYDAGHAHPDIGVPDPHMHDWDWSKIPPRQPGRPLGPGD